MLKKEKSQNPENTAAAVTRGVEPLISEMGLELVDVEYVKEGPAWYLRIFVDRPEGIDHDICQEVSHRVGEWLDAKDPIKTNYTLEVSSPGLERPLKKEADFERFKGRKALVTTFAPVEGVKEFSGELMGIADGSVMIKNREAEWRIPFNMVASARLTFDFKTE
ncbi:MAG: ribosome maturation factor RimP [Firmicutes bacterium]|nr:ribosome maturation factor RimP [Bacillota bacterium]